MDNKDLKDKLLRQIELISSNDRHMQLVSDYISNIIKPLYPKRAISRDNVAKHIRNNLNVIVPVVCDDMFEYVKEDGQILSVKDFVCNQYEDEGHCEVTNAIRENYYYGISLLEKTEREFLNAELHRSISEAIELGKIRLKRSVSTFLKNGNFPIIVTTFGFPLIEKNLGLSEKSAIWYNPNKKNDLPLVKDDSTRCVYHIFGGENSSSWAYNEQTLLRYLHSLHSVDYGAKNLSNYLRKHANENAKRPLILGSSLPDWLFRFFLYPMYEDQLKDVKGYWLSLDDIEKELDDFLERNNYTGQTNLRVDNRVETIIAEVTSEETLGKTNDCSYPKIFVSYKREEAGTSKAEEIERVINILQNQGVVWLDTEKVSDGGNPYWANIKNAVKECDLFIPIVTSRYLEEYRDAVNITQLLSEEFIDANNNNANDNEFVIGLKPVVREVFYALAYHKRCVPIVILDEKANLNVNAVESIAKDKKDSRNLPFEIFPEHTLLLHDDKNPRFFELPNID